MRNRHCSVVRREQRRVRPGRAPRSGRAKPRRRRERWLRWTERLYAHARAERHRRSDRWLGRAERAPAQAEPLRRRERWLRRAERLFAPARAETHRADIGIEIHMLYARSHRMLVLFIPFLILEFHCAQSLMAFLGNSTRFIDFQTRTEALSCERRLGPSRARIRQPMLTASCGRAPPPLEDAPAHGAPKVSAGCAELLEEALAVRAECAALPEEAKEGPLCLEKKRSMMPSEDG